MDIGQKNRPPVLCVIMSTYNGAKYVEEQLDSIIGQDVDASVTIYIRDDGSTDNTVDVLRKYAAGHSKEDIVIDRAANKGAAGSFLTAMRECPDADIYAFSDQDDVWDEDKLRIAVDKISEYPEDVPALYYCGQRLVDQDLNLISDHTLNEKRSLKTRFLLSDFAGCTGVFNKALLDEVNKYEPGYVLMHDTWILKICLGLGGNVYIDSTSHLDYRQHKGNTLGLGRSIPAYIRQVRQYLNEYKVEPQMAELIRGYGDRLVTPYKELAQKACAYRLNRTYKKELLNKRNIDFCSRGLNITYWLKVKLNKL